MARVDVLMPQMGESIAEGTLSKWLKKLGDEVKRDEPLFEISTDKVDAEIPAPEAGVLLAIRVGEGETVPVNSVVAVIGKAGDKDISGTTGSQGTRGTSGTGNALTMAILASGNCLTHSDDARIATPKYN